MKSTKTKLVGRNIKYIFPWDVQKVHWQSKRSTQSDWNSELGSTRSCPISVVGAIITMRTRYNGTPILATYVSSSLLEQNFDPD